MTSSDYPQRLISHFCDPDMSSAPPDLPEARKTLAIPGDLVAPLDRKDASLQDWLGAGGEMGKLIQSMDWTRTPLGPIKAWPQSLRTTVSLCLASNFPISLAWGPEHVQIYNDGYWPICGGKHPQSMGQDFSQCWASAWPVIGEAFTRALAGQTSYLENQRMFLDRNGYLEETFFTFSFSPIRDETGGIGGLFHPVTEMTSNMLSERRTRTLRDLAARAGKAQTIEEAFTLAAQSLSESELDLPFVLIYLLDDPGTEARLIAHTGLRPGTPASPTVIDLRAPQQPAWPLAEVVRSNRAQQIDDLQTQFGHLAAGPYPESPKIAFAQPITLPGYERPVGILLAGISSRLPLNEAYRAFYDLLAAGVTIVAANAHAHQEERKRAEALAEIDRAKTTFFSNISHEFRTPLTLILGPLEDELAECASPLPAARRQRLQTVHRNSLRLLKLVNTLLDFSRIESGRLQAHYEPTDLAMYTAELASVFRSAVEKAGLTLVVDCPPLPEPVYVDRDMWEKIVLNLLSNAFKYTREGEIGVCLCAVSDGVAFSVRDTGMGIPEAEIPRIFERFYRVHDLQGRSHEGTGIGLSLVQELVKMHGGSVRVESVPGQGSIFTVFVPWRAGQICEEQPSEQAPLSLTAMDVVPYVEQARGWLSEEGSQPAEVGPEQAFPDRTMEARTVEAPPQLCRRSRVLLADDNADMRDYVGRLLRDRFDVEMVSDGEAALRAIRLHAPDLVLTDVMMPVRDGFALLRALRADPATRALPIILLSARAGEEARIEGLERGADDYLVKPFSARELVARVTVTLEMAQMRREMAQQELIIQDMQRTQTELRQKQDEIETLNERLKCAMTETHHRVKNSLQLISACIDLCATGYEEVVPIGEFQRLSAQVRSLAAVHAILTAETKHGQEAERLSARVLLEKLLPMLGEVAGPCLLNYKIEDIRLSGRQATSLALITNELVVNAFKHAKKEVQVRLSAQGDEAELATCDDGPGLSEGFDLTHANTGLTLVAHLATWDLHGSLAFMNLPGGRGARVLVTFPLGTE